MKRQLACSTLLSLAFLLLCAPVATCSDDPSNHTSGGGDALCHVYVDVDPNVTLMPLFASVDLGSIQTGEITGQIPFRIDANTQKVRIWCAASKLYKGDDPDTVHVPPIPFVFGSGIEIYPESASPAGGEDNHVEYTGQPHPPIDGFPGFVTQSVVFESAQNNHFSQRVDMVVHWNQADPEKPMGEYSGAVQMLAEVVLP
jgi:hypothetical protein